MLGAHVSPSHWLPIALDHVTAEKGSPASRASALVVLAAMLRVAPAGSLAGEPMAQLAAGLQSEHLRSVMDHPAVRTQLLAALTNAVVGGGTACEPASGHLFRSFLQLRAAEGTAVAAVSAEDGVADQSRGGLPPGAER